MVTEPAEYDGNASTRIRQLGDPTFERFANVRRVVLVRAAVDLILAIGKCGRAFPIASRRRRTLVIKPRYGRAGADCGKVCAG